MSCNIAYETDIEDLLLAPDSDACQAFRSHCEGCESCAHELGMVESTLLLLKGEDPHEARQWHPADEELLGLRKRALGADLAARVELHLDACAPCHDAYAAFGQLVEAPASAATQAAAPSLLERIGSALGSFIDALTPVMRPVPIASALVALLAIGILIQSGPLSGPEPQTGDIVVRGGDRPDEPGETFVAGAVSVTLLAGEEMEVALDAIEGAPVNLTLVAPGASAEALAGSVRIVASDGSVLELPRRTEDGSLQVQIAEGWLVAGRYRVELDGEAGLEFGLEVR